MIKPSRADFLDYPIQKYPTQTMDYYFNRSFQYGFIDNSTKVVSMGSCFGIEIARYLKKLKYNYIVTEKNKFFSAAWDKLYTISAIRQVFEYSLDPESFQPIVRWWERGDKYQDPFRRAFNYKPKYSERAFEKHQECAKSALEQADVITITLGMTELWRDKRDKSTYWRVPPIELFDEEIHEFVIQNVDDVLIEMNRIRGLVPNTKIIWTVSPVPFKATFRKDCDPITANFYSKATLRSAVDLFVRSDENSYYFPSFEAVILGHSERYMPDNRHIKPKIIKNMMLFFKRMFFIEEEIEQEEEIEGE